MSSTGASAASEVLRSAVRIRAMFSLRRKYCMMTEAYARFPPLAPPHVVRRWTFFVERQALSSR
jgi:hypothetical protein